MAGRHQAPYNRYANASNSYGNNTMGNNNNMNSINNNNSLNIPFPPQNSGSMGIMGGGNGSGGNNINSSGVGGPYSSAAASSFSTTPTNTTSPYSTTSSPGYHSPNVSKPHHHPPLQKYILQPPRKLLPYSRSTPAFGYPGMFPQRPNQEEDIMSESNVRNGFVDKPAVSNEQTCAHDIIFGKLQDDQRLLNEMGNFMVDVLRRKRKASSITGPSSFKPPTRTALMESKKEQWIQELANGAVPLRKLSRNVPHGYKGEKLLETLAARQVPFLRATWYIKVVGLSEMAQRNASNAGSSTSHAYNWTMIVMGHLKKQLVDLVPLTNSAGGSMRGYRNSNVPGVGGNSDNQVKPWATPETKARFEARWAYSTKLTRWQYSEGLLDQRNFLKWSLDTLASSGSFEVMWLVLTGLVQDYIDEYRRNRTLTKLLIETLIKAYSAILQCSKFPTPDTAVPTVPGSSNVFTGLKRDIERLIQSLFLSSPDMFVIPKLYHQYRQLFEVILGEQPRIKLAKTIPDICHVMDAYWTMTKSRNEVFCGTLEENRLGSASNDPNNSNSNMMDNSTSKSGATPVTNTPSDLPQDSSKSSMKGSSASSDRLGVDEENIIHTLDTIGRYADSGYLLLDNNNNNNNGSSNNIGGWTNVKGHSAVLASLTIFGGCSNGSTGAIQIGLLNQVIRILCRWATSEARHGDWRAFLVSSILLCWRSQEPSLYSKRCDALQEALVGFLDDQIFMGARSDSNTRTSYDDDQLAQSSSLTAMDVEDDSDQTTKHCSATPVSFLYDTFIRMDLFSYHRYLNRLTARGHLERSQRNRSDVARCLYHLKSLPLSNPAPVHLINQRRVALYGTRRDTNDESRMELDAIRKLQQLAKQWMIGSNSIGVASMVDDSNTDTALFGSNAEDMTEPMVNDTTETFEFSLSDRLEHQMRQLMVESTRYVIIQFTSEWLMGEVKRFVVKNVQIGEDNWRVMTSPGSCLLNARQYVALIKILDCAKDYMSIVHVALWVLEKTNERSVLALVIDTLRQYANIWKLMNMGSLTAKTLWSKHQSLQSHGIRERCVMMYMVQLVQEGYSISDDMRLQLQKDLQMRPKVRGRHVTVSIADELLLVVNSNASKASIQNAVETLCTAYQYQNAALWIGLVLDGTVDIIQQWIKKTAMYGGNGGGATTGDQGLQLTLQRFLCAFTDIIKDIVDLCTLTGQINDTIVDWLSNKVSVVDEMRQPQSWMPLFITLLVSRGLVSLDVTFYRFTLPWFDQISQHFLQDDMLWSTTSNTAASTNVSSTNDGNGGNTANNDSSKHWLHVCENMMILVRLLVVQERCCWVQQDDEAMDDASGIYQQPWALRAEEIFRLETLRCTQLACSLDRIEPMFALMEKLVLIASSLPLSSPLLQELVMLRADLLQIGWFRQACVRDLHGVYQRFSSHGTEASTEKKIKKKMLSIVDELIGGTLVDMGSGHHHHHHHHHLHHAALVQEPDFIDKIKRIFTNVSQWNEEQCRVQVSLLLDNILLSDGQNPNNPHILGGGDVTMMNSNDKPEHDGGDDSISVMNKTNNMDLDAFVRFFFSVVLSSDDHQQRRSIFFKNIIHGLRERVLFELLNYGVRLLEGSDAGINESASQQNHHSSSGSPQQSQQPQQEDQADQTSSATTSASIIPAFSQQQRISANSTPSPAHTTSLVSFPWNVLLLSSINEPFDSTKYTYKSQAFFNIMQYMMAQNRWGNDKKIDLVKILYRQIKRFQSGLLAYQVMQDANTSFDKAVAALDVTKNNVSSAVALLNTEGLSSEPAGTPITLEDLRTSLLIRIRLVVPFASLIWEYPNENECDALSWIRTLITLLGNPIVHGNGSQERFFEFVLDFVSLIIDEVKDLRKRALTLLSTLHGELTTVPAIFQSRVNRILPFSTHNIYLTNSRLATGILGATPTTDPLQQQQHLETCMEQSRPWEWLEDYVSDPPHDNDVPINLGLFRARKSKKVDGTYIRCRT